jgi:hypothetical protein
MDPDDNQEFTDTSFEEGNTNAEGTALTLEQLNEKLGTKYDTVEAALDGLKETKRYVGKAGTVEKENRALKEALNGKSGDFITREQYEQDMFYSKNSDLEPYKDIINARAKDLGVRPADAIEKDASLKQTLEKLRGYDKTEGAKSVLMSNQRLGQVTDDMEKAQTAQKAGDIRGASDSAVKAVMSTFGK